MPLTQRVYTCQRRSLRRIVPNERGKALENTIRFLPGMLERLEEHRAARNDEAAFPRFRILMR
jgi:hypothetical protein